MNRDCQVIEELWAELNPACQIHGCEIDGAGTVHIWILYSRNHQQQPLELVLGNPPRMVIRGLKNAIEVEARARRLSSVKGSTVISGETGNSAAGIVGERDK